MSLVRIGICPVCKHRIKTNSEGKVYSHKNHNEYCTGTGTLVRIVSEYEQFVSAS